MPRWQGRVGFGGSNGRIVRKPIHRSIRCSIGADNPAVLDLTGDESHSAVVATLRDAFDRGHDAVMLRNSNTFGGLKGQKIIVVRDANQLRSPYAIDPAKRDSANLLAALAGLSAAPIGLPLFTPQAER